MFIAANTVTIRPAPFNRKKGEQMKNRKWYSGKTQVFWTCKALLEGRAISHKTEIREVRGWRLGAIVHRLRHEFGWPIETEYRGPDHVAYYSMRKGFDKSKLRFPKSARALGQGGKA